MGKNTNSHFTGEQFLELIAITQIGAWDWDLTTNRVIYSHEWAQLLGCSAEELVEDVSTWEEMVLPEDLEYANEQIERHLRGEVPLYEAEFRMRRKDGTIIWAQDKGHVTEFDIDGKPIRFMGVLQDVSRMKNTEMDLRTSRQTLDLSVSVASLGTWDWDLAKDHITYNDEYLHILGYTQEEITGSMEEWENMNHPEDLSHTMDLLQNYIDGVIPSYECETRMKHKDGSYIWTRDTGRIVERDKEGKAVRIIGAHLNIDSLKRTQTKLESALNELELHRGQLEKEVEERTHAIVEQDQMLWYVNDIAKKLLTIDESHVFDELVYECLYTLGEATNQNRVYIWKDIEVDGVPCCIQVHEWVRGVEPIQGVEEFENVPYSIMPFFKEMIRTGHCLNSFVCNLSEMESEILTAQGVKTILVAPVSIAGKNWGFIGIDNCLKEELFTDLEENMLQMSGFLIASAIHRNETQAQIREMEERTNIMLNATPLCCGLWKRDFEIMACNDEAVRLFELGSQQEYLEHYRELMPEYQPDGELSAIRVQERLNEAFEKSYCKFEFLHQKLNGEPIEAEITLVRIFYKNEYIVAGYIQDLRELKAMLSEMRKVEMDLRLAHEEAMLSSKAKTNFLANMSHEIRTPMNAISGLSDILLRDSPNQEVADYALGIKQASSNLLSIINDILDISKIESGKLEVIDATYNISSVIHDVISISRLRLGNKPLLFVTDIDNNLPSVLYGDEMRIKQILINLLSNAIKFTAEGYFSLHISHLREGNQVKMIFCVKDTGQGIGEKEQSLLFQEFERINTTKNRNIEGTGLGLAITKRLCEMMQGTIEVESEIGVGSTFTVVIPQICKNEKPIASVKRKRKVLLYEPREPYLYSIAKCIRALGCECVLCENYSQLMENICYKSYDYIFAPSLLIKKIHHLMKKTGMQSKVVLLAEYGESIKDRELCTVFLPAFCIPIADVLNNQEIQGIQLIEGKNVLKFTAPDARVLVVDDNQVNLKVAMGLLKPYLFSVDTAENGIEAIDKVSNNYYDLVFMDHMMPEMDGIDATAAIRGMDSSYCKNLPIIALTANAVAGTREIFIQEGMNDFLSKPIEISKLNSILAYWLPKDKQLYAEVLEEKEEVDVEEMETICIDGIDTVKGIAQLGGSKDDYLQILASYFKDSSEKKTSLLEHFGNGEISLFKNEIHAVKSTSATVGAASLAEKAQKLEMAAGSNNLLYIEGALDEFVDELSEVLENMKPCIREYLNTATKEQDESNRLEGKQEVLEEKFVLLEEYIEFVKIDKIEEVINDLNQFSWSEEITNCICNIEKAIAIFDYDQALAFLLGGK